MQLINTFYHVAYIHLIMVPFHQMLPIGLFHLSNMKVIFPLWKNQCHWNSNIKILDFFFT